MFVGKRLCYAANEMGSDEGKVAWRIGGCGERGEVEGNGERKEVCLPDDYYCCSHLYNQQPEDGRDKALHNLARQPCFARVGLREAERTGRRSCT